MQGLETFLLIGMIIFIGFFASILFERTKISDVLLLMLVGIFVGNFLRGQYATVIQIFEGAAPIVGTIALIIILFDGGIDLNVFRAFSELSTATWFTFVNFVASAAFSAVLAIGVFGWHPLHALLLGTIIGGTSSAMVLGLMPKIKADEETKTILALEAALTDALCVVFTITIIQLINTPGEFDASFAANQLFGSFAIAAVMALVAGAAWAKTMYNYRGKPFGYMLSMAAVFMLYWAVEAVKASGAIAVLVFGLFLGNWNELAKMFRSQEGFELDEIFRSFQTEVTFFVRTFFFVYLGIVFSLEALKLDFPPAGLATAEWLRQFASNLPVAALLLLGLLVLARMIGTAVLLRVKKQLAKDKPLLVFVLPRDLAAAVLATLPAANGITLPGLVELVFLVILLTNVVATLGVFFHQKSGTPTPQAAAGKPRIVRDS